MKRKYHAWAWKIKNSKTGRYEFCYWATPEQPLMIDSPSPEARRVKVKFIEVRGHSKRKQQDLFNDRTGW